MTGSSLAFDAVLDLCRHEHRRIVLATLADTQQSVTTNDLAKIIAERDHHAPTATADEAITRTEVSLQHAHLPRLEAAGLVDYDPERQLVEPIAQFDRGEPHLSAILDADSTLATPRGCSSPEIDVSHHSHRT